MIIHDKVSIESIQNSIVSPDDKTSYRHEVLENVSQNRIISADTESVCDTTVSPVSRFLFEIQTSAKMYISARQNFGVRARQHLIEISRIVLAENFDLKEFSVLTGQKLTKPDRENIFRPVLKWAHQNGDQKVISNLSLVLKYVSDLSDNDVDKIQQYFNQKSIKQTLRDYRASRTKNSKNSKKKANENGMTLMGTPPDITGIVTIQIEISDGIATFITLVEV